MAPIIWAFFMKMTLHDEGKIRDFWKKCLKKVPSYVVSINKIFLGKFF